MASPDAAVMAEPSPMGPLARIAGVFFEPSKTFADIARRPSWLVPLVLAIVGGISITFLIGQHVGWERIVRHQVESSSRAQQLSAEQKEQQIQMGVKMAPVFGYAAPVVFAPLYFLLAAGIFTGLVAGVMSAPVKFKQVFAVVTWASLPNLIAAVLTGVVFFLKNPDDIDPQNALMFNLGAYMDPQHSSKFLVSAASSLDLFSFWIMFLMATGLKAAAGKKLSFGGALVVVVLPWAAYVLVKSALAGVFG